MQFSQPVFVDERQEVKKKMANNPIKNRRYVGGVK